MSILRDFLPRLLGRPLTDETRLSPRDMASGVPPSTVLSQWSRAVSSRMSAPSVPVISIQVPQRSG